MALNYLPVTEEITPPITPPRAQRKELDTATEVVPETPPPATKPGRSRGRGTWRAQQKTAPGVGTRSRNMAELTRYLDIQSTHIAACSGALDDNLPMMSAETFPRLTGGIRSALDETDQNPEETDADSGLC